ncbi:alanine racemase [Candidatus Albibeggiatoa sp. nov. BB20]|uniref:alanine racemase n=1 Tax=Candidatus Albibeggiatoa sp. nov. BB20 TaxID=3162723 RepID=UPI0033656563
MRPTQALIDLAALKHNIHIARQHAPQSKIMAVVKADAYGHGAVSVARAITNEVEAFAVCCIEEAIELRQARIQQPILILEGFFETNELPLIQQYDLQTVVQHPFQVDILRAAQLRKPLAVWLKIDTGMGRLGFLPPDFSKAWQQLNDIQYIVKPIKLMTHLACADELDQPMTLQQIQQFSQLIQTYETEKSIANSAGILSWPQAHTDWNRMGIMLYGASPFEQSCNLQAVMQLQSELISVKHYAKGQTVGYGATWQCEQDSIIGIVAIGYADGYPRHAPSGTPVLVNGQRVPLVGRVSMDMIAVGLTQQTQAKVGDKVILWGNDLAVEEIATCAGTISYELLTHVNKRVPRNIINSY